MQTVAKGRWDRKFGEGKPKKRGPGTGSKAHFLFRGGLAGVKLARTESVLVTKRGGKDPSKAPEKGGRGWVVRSHKKREKKQDASQISFTM